MTRILMLDVWNHNWQSLEDSVICVIAIKEFIKKDIDRVQWGTKETAVPSRCPVVAGHICLWMEQRPLGNGQAEPRGWLIVLYEQGRGKAVILHVTLS